LTHESEWNPSTNAMKTIKAVSGFVRVDDNVYGHSSMTYILTNEKGQLVRRETYEMQGDNLVRVILQLESSAAP
jgi:outer membrane protein assembly factor BamB